LLKPLEATLREYKPQTLVLIPDSFLRTVPFAALYDGEQFLIEKYPLATSLGLKLTSKYTALNLDKNAAFGISQAIPPLSSLPFVDEEISKIKTILPGVTFLNQQFTEQQLINQLQEKHSIVHLATHSRFLGTPESSFLQTFDERLYLSDLEKILSSANVIELITFSACETAQGNERSLLGLAGIAVRTGIPSTLGSLWFASDELSVELITDFYTNLKQPGISQAEALRRAQIKQIRSLESHPVAWANFILIGNWL
jgi:CHAT domain-containing protein